MSQARTDFITFLSEASGTHAFALSALQLMLRQVELLPRSPDNPDPIAAWGKGDPNIPGNILSCPGWRTSQLVRNLQPDGASTRYLGWAWITLVYDRWEDDYRHRFAEEMNCVHNQVACDAIGDIRHLRHDITHSKGIATTQESGKCILLNGWYSIGNYIVIDIEHVSTFFDLISNDENAIYRRA